MLEVMGMPAARPRVNGHERRSEGWRRTKTCEEENNWRHLMDDVAATAGGGRWDRDVVEKLIDRMTGQDASDHRELTGRM